MDRHRDAPLSKQPSSRRDLGTSLSALCRHSPASAPLRRSFPKAAIGGVMQHHLVIQGRLCGTK
jgi:hypothetical protein